MSFAGGGYTELYPFHGERTNIINCNEDKHANKNILGVNGVNYFFCRNSHDKFRINIIQIIKYVFSRLYLSNDPNIFLV